MPSFSIPLSGLDANSQALSSIANNLANMNTIGYKDSTTTFRDTLFQNLGTTGSGDPIQIGIGTGLDTNSANFTQGPMETTGVDTDMMIQGQGFFVVQNGAEKLYTRAGNFSVGSDGTLQTTDGSSVMGYVATQSGTIDTTQSIAPISIKYGESTPGNATTSLQMSLNLDSATATTTTSSSPSWSTSAQVYDAEGGQHTVTLNFWNTGSGQWAYSATLPAADLGTTGNPVTLASGTLGFDGNGNLTSTTVDPTSPTGSVTTVSGSAGNVTGITIPSGDNLADGATPFTFTWNLFSSSGSSVVTQAASSFTGNNLVQDGYASGSLQSISVQSNGTIEGVFSNGQSRSIAQLALASFNNDEGLAQVGNNEFQQTLASGGVNIGVASTGGLGTVAGGELEESNVDIATEFSNLILAQRAYEANARTVTTFDQVYQDTINLKTS
jgi:flagellar hook protein FlgE